MLWAAYRLDQGAFTTDVDVARDQPVPFSHKHHVRDDGIDCRYCHTSVENSAFAGLPPTETCMGCHSQIWTNAAMLEPVRASFRSGDDLPDFVYFYKVNTLYMQWCIECHRNPEKYVRPRDQVFNMAYDAPPDQPALGRRLVAEYRIQSLTDCVTCHR